MPYIISTFVYPSDKVDEVLEVYSEILKKLPFDEALGTEAVKAASKTTTQGIEALAVIEVAEGKLEEALLFARKRAAMSYGVEGVESSIDVYSTVEEGLAARGMKLPE
jgi:hypothetical protein